MKKTITLEKLKTIVTELTVPSYDRNDLLDALCSIIQRAQTLGLYATAATTSTGTQWAGWTISRGDISKYRCRYIIPTFLKDVNNIIKKYNLQGVIRLSSNDVNDWFDDSKASCVKWPKSVGKNGNAIRGLAKRNIPDPSMLRVPKFPQIKDLVIENGVVVDCCPMKDVVIPQGVTEIADHAFCKNTMLQSVTFPPTMKIIGAGAFAECSKLKSISIPKSVTNISTGAFRDCTSLRSVSLQRGARVDFGYDSFKNAPIETVTTEDLKDWLGSRFHCWANEYNGNPASIAKHLFVNGKEIVDLVVPAGFKVPEDSFSNVEGLRSVTFLGDAEVEMDAFRDCNNLTKATFKTGVKTLNFRSFGHTGLKQFDVPSLDFLFTPIKDGSRDIFSEDAAVDLLVNGKPVMDLVVPNGVSELNSRTFNCFNLKSVTIPGSVKVLEYGLFANCKELASVTIGNGVQEIESGCFAGCMNLKSIELPPSITLIHDGAFRYCGIDEIVIPDLVTQVGSNAFADCKNLASVKIGKSVKEIRWSAFRDCSTLTSIVIPSNVEDLGSGCFYNCTSLKNVKILNSDLFQKVIKKPDYYFENTPWGNRVKNGGISFDVDDQGTLDKYTGHDTIVVIPDEVEIVGAGAFYDNARLSKVTIPDTVSTIESGAFEECASLKSIVLGVGIKKIEKDAFKNVAEDVTIYVPDFDMCKLLLDSGLPDSATVIIGKGSSRRRLSWDPER